MAFFLSDKSYFVKSYQTVIILNSILQNLFILKWLKQLDRPTVRLTLALCIAMI